MAYDNSKQTTTVLTTIQKTEKSCIQISRIIDEERGEFLDIRDMYLKDGVWNFTQKGLRLTMEQSRALRDELNKCVI